MRLDISRRAKSFFPRLYLHQISDLLVLRLASTKRNLDGEKYVVLGPDRVENQDPTYLP